MGRKLAAYVHVGGQVFAPGDEPPAEAAKFITNPAAWEGDADQAGEETGKSGSRRRRGGSGE